MEQLTHILLQLLAVALSGILWSVSGAPLPLLQVALGAGLSFFTGSESIPEPALLLLLFVAPLLYLDAFHFPQAEFLRLRKPIVAAAVGLVAVTVVLTGYFMHWLLPSVPLPVSFAIAAVLSPTDAVAVAGSLGGARLPGSLMHILEGEALLNDASGLVCLRLAIAAAASGTFSLAAASGTFVLVAAGGILLGAAGAFCIGSIGGWLKNTLGSQPAALILFHLLLPFAVYIAAERLHVSGILAAVAAGFTLQWFSRGTPGAALRLRGSVVTESLQFTFNGLVFVLLGLQLPEIAREIAPVARQQGFASPWTIALLAVEITFALMLLRFVWALAGSFLTAANGRLPSVLQRTGVGRLRAVTVIALAGVRGAVTLAAVLSFPLTLGGGLPLPGRDIAIILSGGVILLWLVLASTALPLLVRSIGKASETVYARQERDTLGSMHRAAMRRLDELRAAPADGVPAELSTEAAERLTDVYRRKLAAGKPEDDGGAAAAALLAAEKNMNLEAIRAERRELHLLTDLGEIEHHSANRLLLALDAAEAALLAR